MLALAGCAAAILRAQQPWSVVESPVTQTLWGVAYGDGRFVAVGEGGAIVTSSDGLAWTARASGTDKWLLDVTWLSTRYIGQTGIPTNDTLFIAVGDAGTILTSPDGITWTPRASGTTQRLNSVAWALNQFSSPLVFLAVGENGTALTSFDLDTWTPRATGVAGWLRGIASPGMNRFIVTGHDGTILATEDAGETFQRRASGTTLHLDAVARFGNDVYATGTDFALTRSNDAGRTWTLDRNVNTDGRENGVVYNGLVAFNNALVIVGDQGRIIDEAGRAWRQTQPLSTHWRAVAASPTRVVAVGTDGGIASAPLDAEWTREIAITQTFVVDSIVLHAAPARAYASRYQWSFNGEPIPGGTSPTLTLDTTTARAGTYTVSGTFLTFDSGTSVENTSTASITLAPTPNPSALTLVDSTFRPMLSAAPHAIVPLADGRVYLAGPGSTLRVDGQLQNSPVRLAADGSHDPSFSVPDGAIPAGTTEALILQPDGRLVVMTRGHNSPPTPSIVRLNQDGLIDATFRPDGALARSGIAPFLLADGRWLGIEQTAATDAGGTDTTVRRFHADGSLDASFAPIMTRLAAAGDLRHPLFSGPRVVSTRDHEGRVYLGIRHNDLHASGLSAQSGKTRVFRLLPDGQRDGTFESIDVEPLQSLQATEAGLIARSISTAWQRLGANVYDSAVFRLRFDGTPDRAFRPITARWALDALGRREGLPHDLDLLVATADDGIIARSRGRLAHLGLVRFTNDGKFDADFAAEMGIEVSAVTALAPLPNGQILVAGTFARLASIAQPWLCRLSPNTRATSTRFTNLSVLARTGPGGDPLVAGYVASGGEIAVLARATGPGLRAFNVVEPQADPQLALFAGTVQIAANDDWSDGPADFIGAVAARLGAFPFAAGSADAAVFATTPGGPSTVHVSGKNGNGFALAELYVASAPPTHADAPRVTNFSVSSASAGSKVIVGFRIEGSDTRNVLIRAVGPGLAGFGVAEFLPDPVLTLFRGATPFASNDDWAVDVDTRLLMLEAFDAVGAFPFEWSHLLTSTPSKDAALLASLAPGSYTAEISPKNGASGVSLLEIYEVP